MEQIDLQELAYKSMICKHCDSYDEKTTKCSRSNKHVEAKGHCSLFFDSWVGMSQLFGSTETININGKEIGVRSDGTLKINSISEVLPVINDKEQSEQFKQDEQFKQNELSEQEGDWIGKVCFAAILASMILVFVLMLKNL